MQYDFGIKERELFMIALITPTGSRADQFKLCTMFMERQTYKGEVTWIIVDDAYPSTTDRVDKGFKDNWTIIKVYPTPIWQGQNTQSRNMQICFLQYRSLLLTLTCLKNHHLVNGSAIK